MGKKTKAKIDLEDEDDIQEGIQVPNTVEQSVDWLRTLHENLQNMQQDYSNAIAAVARRYKLKPANLKAAINAKEKDKIQEELDKLNEKMDTIQLVADN